MIKQNIFNDKSYCKLLVMCLYRCPFGITTFALDSHMSDIVMQMTDSNSSMFINLSEKQESGDLYGNADFDE
jgi:hypothetical protein